MAARRKIPLIVAALLVILVVQANAQGQPSVSGGSAMRRVDTPRTPAAPSWQVRDLSRWLGWATPRWLPGHSPVGGSFAADAMRPERRSWLRSRLP